MMIRLVVMVHDITVMLLVLQAKVEKTKGKGKQRGLDFYFKDGDKNSL